MLIISSKGSYNLWKFFEQWAKNKDQISYLCSLKNFLAQARMKTNRSNESKIRKVENPKAQKLLNKIQRDLMRNGIITNTIVDDLKTLRPYAVEEQNPLLAKVIRLTYEHIETYETFNIPIPEDEPIEGLEGEEENLDVDVETNTNSTIDPEESLDYLLSLMAESKNRVNELELREFSHSLLKYAEEN